MRYVQLCFVSFFAGGILYLTYIISVAMLQDIEKKHQIEIEVQNAKILKCVEEYTTNLCEPGSRVPALKPLCEEWELCMNTPLESQVMNVKNVANLIAQTVDSFILQLSYTSMGFIALVLILVFKYGLPAMINIVHTEM